MGYNEYAYKVDKVDEIDGVEYVSEAEYLEIIGEEELNENIKNMIDETVSSNEFENVLENFEGTVFETTKEAQEAAKEYLEIFYNNLEEEEKRKKLNSATKEQIKNIQNGAEITIEEKTKKLKEIKENQEHHSIDNKTVSNSTNDLNETNMDQMKQNIEKNKYSELTDELQQTQKEINQAEDMFNLIDNYTDDIEVKEDLKVEDDGLEL